MRVRHIAVRFALILGIAAVLPLVAYGIVSILSLQRSSRETVTAGHLNVATRAAEEIRRYVSSHAAILKALAAEIQDTPFDTGQLTAILRNYVLEFAEFRELTLFDESGAVITTSRIGAATAAPLTNPAATFDGIAMSEMRTDEDALPTATFAVLLKRLNRPVGSLVGEISLEEMWRMVDQIRIGQQGFALIVAPDGTVIAHGDPDRKAMVARGERLTNRPLARGDGAPDTR
jgi:hypothetical protein